jgi:aldehyde dehydrogenase (NAD+)
VARLRESRSQDLSGGNLWSRGAVISFESEEEAVRLANDTIQTGDLRRALRLADRIKAGTVWLNTWHKYYLNAPFGGYKMSGYGREHGAEALESYTQYKTIWANLG